MKPEIERTLVEKAKEVRRNAYSPYFKVFVGAALLGKDGSIHVGVNVENAAGSAIFCAETSALGSAISKGVREFEAIAVVGFDDKLLYPCGVCCQRLAEFNPRMQVLVASTDGKLERHGLDQLLTHPCKI